MNLQRLRRLPGLLPSPARRVYAAICIVPVAAALAGAALGAFRGTDREIGCWVLPNARVIAAPGDDECPLRLHDRILQVELQGQRPVWIWSAASLRALVSEAPGRLRVAVDRGGREEWVEVSARLATRAKRLGRVATAAIIAAALAAVPLALLWRSSSTAAVPLAFFYSAAAVVAITLTAGHDSDWLTRLSLFAMTTAPASLAHLSFTFPIQRKVALETPQVMAAPYLLTVVLVGCGWFALDRNPLLWPTFMYLLLTLTAGAWLVLILSCGFAIRESTHAIERARARLMWYGALALAPVPTFFLTRSGATASELLIAYLWLSAVTLPIPIGIAISRYNLFDLEWDVRRGIARLVYFGTAALILTVMLSAGFALFEQPLLDPAPLFALSFGCVALVEPIRGRFIGLLEAVISPRIDHLRRLRTEYQRDLSERRDEDQIVSRLAEVLRQGLNPQAGCIFVRVGGDWRPAQPFGVDAPTQTHLAREAESALTQGRLIHLSLTPHETSAAYPGLSSADVELVATIDGSGLRYGVLLLNGSSRAALYSAVDLEFVAMATSQAGIALHDARSTSELLTVERHATTGRVALALAHEVGKELDWMRRLVARLPKRLDDRARLMRDILLIQEFTEGLVARMRDFVADATESTRDPPGIRRVDDLLESTVERLSKIHGTSMVALTLDPTVRSLRCHENVGRVVANVLDNALRASAEDDPVRLSVTTRAGAVEITVSDSGPGLPDELLERAFDLGFTTRRDSGGLGVGLTVSREIVDSLGGSIGLSRNPEGGLSARIRVPVDRGEGR